MQDPFKTLSELRKELKVQRSKSMNNFVLINKNREIQQNYQWQPFKTRKSLLNTNQQSLNRQISYSQKKSILTNLQDSSQKSYRNNKLASQMTMQTFIKSKFNLQQKRINKDQYNKSILFKKNSLDQILAKQPVLKNFTTTKNSFYSKADDLINRKIRTSDQTNKQKKQIIQTLQKKIHKASVHNQRIINVFSFRRYGLRIRLNNALVPICLCSNQKHELHKLQNNLQMNQIVKQMFPSAQFTNQSKKIYYFDLNKQPIFNSQQIPIYTYAIIASTSPKLQIQYDFYEKLQQEASKIRYNIQKIQRSLNINYKSKQQYAYQSPRKNKNKEVQNDSQQFSTKYDWQIIKNIDQHVQKICSNPQLVHEKRQQNKSPLKTKIHEWFKEGFSDRQLLTKTKKLQKNPLLQDFNHFPNQTKDKRLLNRISEQLQQYEFINNPHIINRFSSINGLQLAKRQQQLQLKQQQQQKSNMIKKNINNTLISKGSILKKLDNKHTLLYEQNLPYMMSKYGISRYEIHNLYSLYKTLQIISALRINNINKVIKKGIDKNTFDQGMKKLDINPGDQVIKNICLVDDFISWEQFIKIISIGLRKTPEEKLQAILSGIVSINQGAFTKKHIGIMIGSSLSKIFDSEQPQLKQYFTQVAMNQLDQDKSGTIEVAQLKKKILSADPQNPDLVTFLLLNS